MRYPVLDLPVKYPVNFFRSLDRQSPEIDPNTPWIVMQ
jgi:hypothetical protein